MIATSVIVLIVLGFTAAAVYGGRIQGPACGRRSAHRRSGKPACPAQTAAAAAIPVVPQRRPPVVAGKAAPDLCVAGGTEIAKAIANVMGMSVEFCEPKVADIICTGGDRADKIYAYEGVQDCRAEAMLYCGDKSCGLGCIGMGTCVRACPFDALHLDEHNLPVVNKALCRSCGKCAEICPTGAIRISGLSASLLHVNKLRDCLAPCMQKCPVQIDVRTFIHQLTKGCFADALLTIKNRNPMPLIVGRICPHPCEQICRRNILDEGVAISTLQRFVADWEMQSGKRVPLPLQSGHRTPGGRRGSRTVRSFLRLFPAPPGSSSGRFRHPMPRPEACYATPYRNSACPMPWWTGK